MEYYLYHHGILGQRWGKRNGPPYPLGASNHSSSEKKAGWKKSLDKNSQEDYTKDKKKSSSTAKKRAIKIGVAAVATALAAYGTYRLAKSGKLDELAQKGKDKLKSIFGKETETRKFDVFLAGNADDIFKQSKSTSKALGGFRKLAKRETVSELVNNVNPLRGTKAGENNCAACGLATFFRSYFGIDVTAKSTGGVMQNLGGVVEKCFKGAKVFDGSAVKFGRSRNDAAEMLLRRFGNNAEGVVNIQWRGSSGGHIFNWKIKNGIVSFFDGQQGLTDDKVSIRYWKNIDPNGFLQIARLDGLEVIWDAAKEFVG